MAVATWPPGRMLAERNSTLEPAAGKWWTGMSVSVALRPTPTTSILREVGISRAKCKGSAARCKEKCESPASFELASLPSLAEPTDRPEQYPHGPQAQDGHQSPPFPG